MGTESEKEGKNRNTTRNWRVVLYVAVDIEIDAQGDNFDDSLCFILKRLLIDYLLDPF